MKDYKTYYGDLVKNDWPNTIAKNASSSTTNDGTPVTAELINDLWGHREDLMNRAGLTPNGATEACGSSQYTGTLQAVIRGPGEFVLSALNTSTLAGRRLLPLTGQVIAMSSYAELCSAVYCGDGNNASAPAFYKTSDAAGQVRSISGAYMVLPDCRGLVPRGLGASTSLKDAKGSFYSGGSYIGSIILDQLAGHYHGLSDPGHSHNIALGSHAHDVVIGSHSHDVVMGSHAHDVVMGSHSHDVVMGSHTHDTVMGSHNLSLTPPSESGNIPALAAGSPSKGTYNPSQTIQPIPADLGTKTSNPTDLGTKSAAAVDLGTKASNPTDLGTKSAAAIDLGTKSAAAVDLGTKSTTAAATGMTVRSPSADGINGNPNVGSETRGASFASQVCITY